MLLTLTEAAKRLGVSWYAVKNAVNAGRISTVVLSKKQLIPETELEKLLKIDPNKDVVVQREEQA